MANTEPLPRVVRRQVALLIGALAVAVAVTGCTSGSSGGRTAPVTDTSVPAATSGSAAPSAPPTGPQSGTSGSDAASAGSSPATSGSTATPSDVPALPAGWTEQDIQFDSPQGTIYGTFTHRTSGQAGPAALIIGGSGPDDRNGNTPSLGAPSTNTLLTVSRWLAADGMASLRYDKLGAGKTGQGNLTEATASVLTFQDYLRINGLALAFLANQPGVSADRISLVGHSEGGLFASELATGQGAGVAGLPAIHSVAELEPATDRALTTLGTQLKAQVAAQQQAGALTAAQTSAIDAAIDTAIADVRAGKPVPTDLPGNVSSAFPVSSQVYLRTEDLIDPLTVAGKLPKGLPVLFSCSDADIQIICPGVQKLIAVAKTAGAAVTFLHQADVDHILKVDTSRTGNNYNADLPFSPSLRPALAAWAKR